MAATIEVIIGQQQDQRRSAGADRTGSGTANVSPLTPDGWGGE